MRQGWGQEDPAFRQIFTSQFMPGATLEHMEWFNDLQRVTASTENAVGIRKTLDEIDVTELAGRVSVPTLVVHCRDDAVVPLRDSRRMASIVPGARFVTLEGQNHLMLESDPDWERFKDEIGAFLMNDLATGRP